MCGNRTGGRQRQPRFAAPPATAPAAAPPILDWTSSGPGPSQPKFQTHHVVVADNIPIKTRPRRPPPPLAGFFSLADEDWMQKKFCVAALGVSAARVRWWLLEVRKFRIAAWSDV